MDRRALARHLAVFDPARFNPARVVVLGVGGGGLTIALLIAKLGIENVLVCDWQEVEPENLGTSLYGRGEIGARKVSAAARKLRRETFVKPVPYHGDVSTMKEFGDVVFLCVDSNDLKRELLAKIVALGDKAPRRVFEGRMSAKNFLIHSFNPRNDTHVARWHDFYLPDEQVPEELPGCGAVRVALSTAAMMSSSMLVQLFMDWASWELRGQTGQLINQVFFDISTFTTEPDSWGE